MDLAIWMIGCGLIGGLLFPFFLMLIGIPSELSLRWVTFVCTILAGIGMGVFNNYLAHKVVRPELRSLVQGMREVEDAFREATFTGEWNTEHSTECSVAVNSEDEIGETAQAFNELVTELIRVQSLEAASNELTEAISSKLDLEDLSDQAISLVMKHTGAAAGAILVANDDHLSVAANHGLGQSDRLVQSDHVRRALKTNEIQFIRVNPDMVIEGVIADYKPSQILIFPISFEDNTLGVLILASDQLFGKDAMWLLRIFQQGMGLALNNALTHDRLQQVASRDPLTSLYNRRFGMDRLGIEFQQAASRHTPLGVIMFDIDHFKRVNDTYGHLTGDQVLVEVSSLARKAIRESDVLIRYGGEEFVIVMPGAKPNVIKEVAERLRANVAGYDFQDGEQHLKITVSLGVTSYSPDLSEPDSLLREADEALYAAKEGGRDRVYVSAGGQCELVSAGAEDLETTLV
jgi:diguanylate cyclase (GGDEF)-like protein